MRTDPSFVFAVSKRKREAIPFRGVVRELTFMVRPDLSGKAGDSMNAGAQVGGEPLMQDRFAVRLFAAAKQMGIHTALNTNGHLGERLTVHARKC